MITLLTVQFTESVQTVPQPLEQHNWLVQLLSSVHSFTQSSPVLVSTDGHTSVSIIYIHACKVTVLV